MSDREEQYSPASSATDYEQLSNATVDSSLLSLSLSKEQLRTAALQRLSEVRSQLANQLKSVQNQLTEKRTQLNTASQ